MADIIDVAMLGALILVSMICMALLVINNIRLQNYALKQMEKQKQGPWTWD